MSGCRSCSGQTTDVSYKPVRQVEKLEKGERSNNPRYPHVFEGRQAIYSDDSTQLIVTVVKDECDDGCDRFRLEPQRVLKDEENKFLNKEPFEVSQPAGDVCWKLLALI